MLRPARLRLIDLNSTLSLQSPTGAVEIIDSLSHTWVAADRMLPAPLADPLDDAQIKDIERAMTAR